MLKKILKTCLLLSAGITLTVSSASAQADTAEIWQPGDTLQDSAYVISLEGMGEFLSKYGAKKDSIIAHQGTLIGNLRKQVAACQQKSAWKDTVMARLQDVSEAETALIERMQEAEPSFLDEMIAHGESFVLGGVAGRLSCP